MELYAHKYRTKKSEMSKFRSWVILKFPLLNHHNCNLRSGAPASIN